MRDWISCSAGLPRAEDADEAGRVLVWHRYQGAMFSRWDRVAENRFHSHWTPVRIADDAWISKAMRAPTQQDADAYGCVLVRSALDGVHMAGWRQARADAAILAWLPLPDPP